MKNEKKTVVVVACSGIGKSFGSVGREAAYELCENLRPDDTQIVSLSKLVMGDKAARETVARNPVVTIDGCKHMCAAKMVKQIGGTIICEATVFDAYRRHKELKPEGIAELNEQGLKLARVLAEEIANSLPELAEPESKKGGRHD